MIRAIPFSLARLPHAGSAARLFSG